MNIEEQNTEAVAEESVAAEVENAPTPFDPLEPFELVEPVRIIGAKSGDVVNEIATITPRKLFGRDLVEAMDESAGGTKAGSMFRVLMQRCSGLTIKQIDGLCLTDFMRLQKSAEAFLPDSLTTGLKA